VNNRTCAQARAAAAHPLAGPPLPPGIPALLSPKWRSGGRLRSPVQDYPYPGVVDDLGPDSDDYTAAADLTPCEPLAEVAYLNKPGLTRVAGSSVGIVQGLWLARRRFSRHYIVSFFSSLGSRFGDAARMQAVGLTQSAPKLTHVSTTQAIPILRAC
jgi:hypothetical protein